MWIRMRHSSRRVAAVVPFVRCGYVAEKKKIRLRTTNAVIRTGLLFADGYVYELGTVPRTYSSMDSNLQLETVK